jgi:UDP-N-acetyl-D-glucosamine dehydrogenase
MRCRVHPPPEARAITDRFLRREGLIGIIGLGYVGLPLALTFCGGGWRVLGFDTDPDKVARLRAGQSYISYIANDRLTAFREQNLFDATTDMARLGDVDAIIICVPTPLTKQRDPDLSFIVATTEAIQRNLKPGQVVVLESTTYPGTTTEVMRPILERDGLKSGRDFFLAYSPEREDPGNPDVATATIPKIVGGDGEAARDMAVALYGTVVVKAIAVSSTQTAEAVKLTENIFRAVNIALVNELKLVYERMGIDIWEVIEAAKTKPFGYMAFYPGPGLGGHCIPIDPFYLSWKAREYDVSARFVELAGEVNTAMPAYVVERLAGALNGRFARPLNGARILLIGVAYKKNVEDTRESPAFRLMALMRAQGARVDYYDPHVPVIPLTRAHPEFRGERSITFTVEAVEDYDAALICTDHDAVDYAALVRHSKLVVDTRNATRAVTEGRLKIVSA